MRKVCYRWRNKYITRTVLIDVIFFQGTYTVGESSNPFDPTSAGISFAETPPYDALGTKVQEKSEPPFLPAAGFIDKKPLQQYLNTATFCNLATVDRHKDTQEWGARGDPTEIAIQVFTSRFDWGRRKFTQGDNPTWAQTSEYPFDSDVKRMTVTFQDRSADTESGYRRWAFMKGAVEKVMEACNFVQFSDKVAPLDGEMQQTIIKNMEVLASQGLRVLALAQRPLNTQVKNWDELPRHDIESDMTLLGLIGLYDPPRIETADAVRQCHRAGINVHMVTGDHPETARAIAAQVGIVPRNVHLLAPDIISAMVMTAARFDRLSNKEIDDLPLLPLVIARCAPQTKVRMVEAMHRRGKFVAMTGDGVNDSPALKCADVGIGMGMAGSDVAKDASDIILTDDNFASILNSIEEGRRMFDNIKKVRLRFLSG